MHWATRTECRTASGALGIPGVSPIGELLEPPDPQHVRAPLDTRRSATRVSRGQRLDSTTFTADEAWGGRAFEALAERDIVAMEEGEAGCSIVVVSLAAWHDVPSV